MKSGWNGLWGPFEGWKYSGSRIRARDVVFIENACDAADTAQAGDLGKSEGRRGEPDLPMEGPHPVVR